MTLLALVRIAFTIQLAVAGISLLVFGVTWQKRRITQRLARHRAPGFTLLRDEETRRQPWFKRFGEWLCSDIPADDRAAMAAVLQHLHVPRHMGAAAFGWARFTTVPLLTLILAALIYGLLHDAIKLSVIFGLSAAIGGAVALIGARRFAARRAQARRDAVTRKIPYALELILIFLDAGLSLTVAFERVADVLIDRQPALHEELRRTLADLRVLGSQDLAFKNMAERINTPNVNSIVNILRQSIQYGSPISEAMQNAITLMRRTEIILMEEHANKLPSKITLMTLVFIFPPFVIILAGPAMIGLTSALTQF